MRQENTFVIRPLGPADRAGWQPIWNAYHDFYKTSVSDAVYDTTFARLTSGSDGMAGLVATDGGHILGIAHYLFHSNTKRIEPVCYMQDLFTLPAARGKGVARALIHAVYERADAAGAPSVYWMTAEDNYYGRILYDQVGTRTPFIRYMRPE